MGEASDNALQYFQDNIIGQKRRDKRRKKNSMMECKFCKKFPLFFHEYEKYKWILAEWDEENKPVRHVCKLKERLNNVRRLGSS